jgi:hypothetical protein
MEGHKRDDEPLGERGTDSSPRTFHSTAAVSGGSWPALMRRRSCSRDTSEHIQFDNTAAESRTGWECKMWRHCGCKRARRAGCKRERKKIMGSKVLNLCPTHGFKGASAAPHLRRWARPVSKIFAHARAPHPPPPHPWRNNRPLARRLDPCRIRTHNICAWS